MKKSQTTRKNNFHFTKINRKNTKTVLKYNVDIKNARVKNANVKKNRHSNYLLEKHNE